MTVEPDTLTLTPRDAARLVGIGRDRIYELVHTGALTAIRVGHRIRIPRAALEAWVLEEAERQTAQRRPRT